MKMKKLARVFTSAVLVSAMVATMGGMTAFAEVPAIPVNKEVQTPVNTFAPTAEYQFELVEVTEDGTLPSDAFTGVDGATTGSSGSLKLTAGNEVKDGVKLELVGGGKGAAFDSKTPKEEKTGDTEHWFYTVQGGTITVDEKKFQEPGVEPGIYHYQIKESVAKTPVTGMKYDSDVRDIYVYVTYNAATGKNEVNNVIIAKGGVKDGMENIHNSSSVTFKNIYDGVVDNKEGFYDLVVEKRVEGNQGERGRDFFFNLSATASDGRDLYVTFGAGNMADNGEINTMTQADGLKGIKLKDKDTVTIHNLMAGKDSYSVEEVADTLRNEGYTVKVFNGNAAAEVDFESITDNTKNGVSEVTYTPEGEVVNQKVVIENKKHVTTPTGIVLSFAPYILLVALAGVFGVLFLRRRKEEF